MYLNKNTNILNAELEEKLICATIPAGECLIALKNSVWSCLDPAFSDLLIKVQQYQLPSKPHRKKNEMKCHLLSWDTGRRVAYCMCCY